MVVVLREAATREADRGRACERLLVSKVYILDRIERRASGVGKQLSRAAGIPTGIPDGAEAVGIVRDAN